MKETKSPRGKRKPRATQKTRKTPSTMIGHKLSRGTSKLRPHRKAKEMPESFLDKLIAAIKQRIIGTVVGLIFVAIVWILSYTNVGDWWRKALNVKNEFSEMRIFTLEGRVVNCDSIPIGGITVIVQGHDVKPADTDHSGFFRANLKLPVAIEEVPIRFVDESGQEIYSTLYTLDKNSIKNDELQVYAIPEEKLNQYND